MQTMADHVAHDQCNARSREWDDVEPVPADPGLRG